MLPLSSVFLIITGLFFQKKIHQQISVVADNEIGVLDQLIRSYDWKPRGIVDVGANRGGWTSKVQRKFPGVKTYMVEASPSHEKELEEVKNEFSPYVDYQIVVMSEEDGKIIDFFSTGSTGDSMFVEQTKFYKDIKPESRKTMTLDTVVKDMEYVDYLKVDVQGAELMVLAGASEVLKKSTFVQLEVSVVEYNKGGACWHDIDKLLRQHGFYFYDSADYSRNVNLFRSKGLGQFDVLYMKPDSDYAPNWLLEHEIQFCGTSERSTTVEETSNPSDETEEFSLQGIENVTSSSPISAETEISSSQVSAMLESSLNFYAYAIVPLIAFLVGYKMGKMGKKGKLFC